MIGPYADSSKLSFGVLQMDCCKNGNCTKGVVQRVVVLTGVVQMGFCKNRVFVQMGNRSSHLGIHKQCLLLYT